MLPLPDAGGAPLFRTSARWRDARWSALLIFRPRSVCARLFIVECIKRAPSETMMMMMRHCHSATDRFRNEDCTRTGISIYVTLCSSYSRKERERRTDFPLMSF